MIFQNILENVINDFVGCLSRIQYIFENVQKNIIDIFSTSFLKILGAKNNPVRSSISDQYYYFLRKSILFKHNFPLKDIPKRTKLLNVSCFFIGKIT